MIQEVTCYRTRDGKLFEERHKADAHAAELDLRDMLADQGVGGGGHWSAYMVAEVLIEHAAAFKDLLDAIARGK